jgi:hypothetical protein
VDTALNNCLDQAKAIATDPNISALWQLSCHTLKKAGDDAAKAAADHVELNVIMVSGLIGFAIGAFLFMAMSAIFS